MLIYSHTHVHIYIYYIIICIYIHYDAICNPNIYLLTNTKFIAFPWTTTQQAAVLGSHCHSWYHQTWARTSGETIFLLAILEVFLCVRLSCLNRFFSNCKALSPFVEKNWTHLNGERS